MALIDDVELVPTLDGGKLRSFDEFPNIIDSGIAGGVNFDGIESIAPSNGTASFASAAGLRTGAVEIQAVERLGQNTSARGFARAPGTGKEISWGNFLLT